METTHNIIRTPFKALNHKYNSAFTLVELIVVIVILAILATIAFLSFSSQLSSARDSTRLADTNSLRKGLELYSATAGTYPFPENITGTGIIGSEELSYVGSIKDSISRLIMINKAPIDPSGTNNYYAYGVSYNKVYYQIGAVLENPVALNYNPFITFVNAATVYQTKVSGNYAGLIKKNNTIYNLPSLIFSNSGTVDLSLSTTYFVVDKSSNLPYSPDSSVLTNTQTPSQILNILGASGSSLTVTGITISNWNTQSGTLVFSLGYPLDTIGIVYYGAIKYNSEIKGAEVISGGAEAPPAGTGTCIETATGGYFTFNAGTISAYSNSGSKDVVIPCKIGGVDVKVIGASAFRMKNLTSVIIPSSITNIQKEAFNLNKLPDSQAFIYQRTSSGLDDKSTIVSYGGINKNPIIPNTVTTIGDNTFTSDSLTGITIPNSVTSFGNYSFYNNQLTSVIIPDSITNIPQGAFQNNKLTSVTIPNSVTSIGSTAFQINELTSVSIPNSVTFIGGSAFNVNKLPDSQAYIYGRTATGAEDKTKIIGYGGINKNPIIPDGVTIIGDQTFMNDQITTVSIPSGVTSIGTSAFLANQLTTVSIPSGVTSIGSFAFQSNQLSSIVIPSSVATINGYAFKSNLLTNVTFLSPTTTIDNLTFSNQSGGTGTVTFADITQKNTYYNATYFDMTKFTSANP